MEVIWCLLPVCQAVLVMLYLPVVLLHVLLQRLRVILLLKAALPPGALVTILPITPLQMQMVLPTTQLQQNLLARTMIYLLKVLLKLMAPSFWIMLLLFHQPVFLLLVAALFLPITPFLMRLVLQLMVLIQV